MEPAPRFRFSGLGFLSDFGFRISDFLRPSSFVLRHSPGMNPPPPAPPTTRRDFLRNGTRLAAVAGLGALGGLLAFVFINAGKWLLAPSIAELAQLYDASFSLQGPSAAHGLLLVACGALLGWIGAFLSVSLSLRDPK